MTKTISLQVKEAMKVALETLGATNDGTEVLQVITSGEDQFDEYPTIRILPQDYNRSIDAENREYMYTMSFVVSIYLEIGEEGATPQNEIIDAMQELVDMTFEKLDEGDWLDTVTLPSTGSIFTAQNDSPVVIDVTASQTGIALYADISYGVTYKKSF